MIAETNKDNLIDEKANIEKNLSNHVASQSALKAKIDQIKNRHKNLKDIELALNNKDQQQKLLSSLEKELKASLDLITKIEDKRSITCCEG